MTFSRQNVHRTQGIGFGTFCKNVHNTNGNYRKNYLILTARLLTTEGLVGFNAQQGQDLLGMPPVKDFPELSRILVTGKYLIPCQDTKRPGIQGCLYVDFVMKFKFLLFTQSNNLVRSTLNRIMTVATYPLNL